MIEEVLYRPYIRCNGVLCQIGLGKIIFEFCYHMPLIYNEYSNNIRECVGHYVHVLLTNPPSGMAVLMYPAIQHGERNNVKYIREQNITTIFQTDTNIFRFRYRTGRPPALRRAKRFPRRISPITATVPMQLIPWTPPLRLERSRYDQSRCQEWRAGNRPAIQLQNKLLLRRNRRVSRVGRGSCRHAA